MLGEFHSHLAERRPRFLYSRSVPAMTRFPFFFPLAAPACADRCLAAPRRTARARGSPCTATHGEYIAHSHRAEETALYIRTQIRTGEKEKKKKSKSSGGKSYAFMDYIYARSSMTQPGVFSPLYSLSRSLALGQIAASFALCTVHSITAGGRQITRT